MHFNLGLARNADRFADGAEQADGIRVFVPQVTIVDAVARRSRLGKLDHFFTGRIAAGRVVQARGHSQRAFVNATPDQRPHAIQLVRVWRRVTHAHHFASYRALADV